MGLSHNTRYVAFGRGVRTPGFFILYDQSHMLQLALVLFTGRNDIYTGRVDAGMSENIGELGYILFDAVKRAGKKVPQIMRKHLRRGYPPILA